MIETTPADEAAGVAALKDKLRELEAELDALKNPTPAEATNVQGIQRQQGVLAAEAGRSSPDSIELQDAGTATQTTSTAWNGVLVKVTEEEENFRLVAVYRENRPENAAPLHGKTPPRPGGRGRAPPATSI